jgi:hypothetical protein
LDLLRRDRALTPSEQLAVYRDSIAATLGAAVAEAYPVCRRLVGERFFAAAAAAFVRRAPSRSPDLDDYGEGFAAFLAEFPPAAALAYLPDMARLEWAWHVAAGRSAARGFELDALAAAVAAGADPERVVFRLAESATLLESPFPVHLIWRANQPGSEQEDVVVGLAAEGARLLVWHDGQGPRIETLRSPEWLLLRAAGDGQPLGQACERVASTHPGADLGRLLGTAIRRGWLSGFEAGASG